MEWILADEQLPVEAGGWADVRVIIAYDHPEYGLAIDPGWFHRNVNGEHEWAVDDCYWDGTDEENPTFKVRFWMLFPEPPAEGGAPSPTREGGGL